MDAVLIWEYFKNTNAVDRFLEGANTLTCPTCGAYGTFVRHGYVRGSVSVDEGGRYIAIMIVHMGIGTATKLNFLANDLDSRK